MHVELSTFMGLRKINRVTAPHTLLSPHRFGAALHLQTVLQWMTEQSLNGRFRRQWRFFKFRLFSFGTGTAGEASTWRICVGGFSRDLLGRSQETCYLKLVSLAWWWQSPRRLSRTTCLLWSPSLNSDLSLQASESRGWLSLSAYLAASRAQRPCGSRLGVPASAEQTGTGGQRRPVGSPSQPGRAEAGAPPSTSCLSVLPSKEGNSPGCQTADRTEAGGPGPHLSKSLLALAIVPPESENPFCLWEKTS